MNSENPYLDRVWQQHYKDVPTEINPDEYENLIDYITRSFKEFGPMIAFENMGKQITYRELDRKSRDFAAWLQYKGLKPGDRMIIQLPNLLQFPVAMFGAMRAGVVLVNTNPLYTAKEMRHQFKDSGAKAILILANFADKLEEVIADTDIETVIVTEVGDLLGGLKGWITNLVVKYVKRMVPSYKLPGHFKFNQVLKEGRSKTYDLPNPDINDIALLQYTGGTTGLSKGACLSHRNLLANMMQIFAWVKPVLLNDKKDIIITALPLYHIFALTVNCMAFFGRGGHNVLITNPRDIPGFVKELKKHRFSIFTGLNTLFNALLNNKDFRDVDFSGLRLTLGGGMAVQEPIAKRWERTTGCNLAEAYGLSETSPGLTANPLDGRHRIGYIGVPIPSTDIYIADDEGKPVPIGERGELCAKGPQVMKHYWNLEEKNEEVFRDGWFKTGDIAIMTEDGFFKIVDRKKEMILVSGFNVYPSEVEAAIMENEKVDEVGVIGIPSDKSGEVVKAFVVKKDDSLTEEELIAFCREQLAAYKVPKAVEFRIDLPKSNVGKILRRKLVESSEAPNKM